MPRGDGTGPLGMGPMTGWGTGRCAGFAASGWGMGRFLGRCAGFGRRFRGGFAGAPDDASSGSGLPGLKTRAEYLKQSLDQIEKRINEIEKA